MTSFVVTDAMVHLVELTRNMVSSVTDALDTTVTDR